MTGSYADGAARRIIVAPQLREAGPCPILVRT
jgi:hypothetical protein